MFFFFQAEDGIRDLTVTGVQTCALPISFGDALRCGVQSPRKSSSTSTRNPGSVDRTRSEEHTSELQSQSNLVCRLLLEKKKNTNHTSTLIYYHNYVLETLKVIRFDDHVS